MPSLMAITAPVLVGLVFDVGGVMGLLVGGLTAGFAVAIFMANAGGAWDNARKLIETFGTITAKQFRDDSAVRARVPAGIRNEIAMRAANAADDYIVYGKGSEDHKAGIVGDTVDNLSGVPGVGPKGAAAALRAFGRIEDVPADPAAWAAVKVRGAKRLAALLDEHRELALRTRELATLVCDVPGLRADLRSVAWHGADPARVETLFEELGWNRIADRIPRYR